MRVLMISGDKNAFVPGTGAFERLQLQKKAVEQLDVFVWPQVHSMWQIWQAARKERYDVITAQDPFWRGLLALKVAHFSGARHNVQVHADLSAESFVRRTIARAVLRQADTIRVVSDRLKTQVESLHTRAPISVLPVFIDIEPFRTVVRTPHAVPTILWIGRFEEEKDPVAAIAVLKELHARKINVKLIMLGEGSRTEYLRKAAKGLPVEFPGWKNPAEYLGLADVVLSTSRQESYGASIIESLVAGIPVVAPDVGVAREAGANVVARAELAQAVADTLQSGSRGTLRLALPNAEEWIRRWKASL